MYFKIFCSYCMSKWSSSNCSRYEQSANIEAKNKHQRTSLHYACEEDNLQIVQYLIEKGSNIEVTNFDEKTPLLYAYRY